jgi:hypothetical protein
VLLASDGDRDFIEVPDVATVWSLALEAVSVCGPNFSTQRRTVS